ncbi:MAG TPA: phenylalanine--tRNA ligase subunit beta [Candidatus Saccharimonadales bacterium]|nr:phenylalanine--tRNA ligase subunit beta [Candidatus Saccharimonadales bacterium]
MKVSLNQLKLYEKLYGWSDFLSKAQLDPLIDKIGAQLGAVEEVVYLSDKYKRIVIVKVVEAIKHPGADKLSLCRIDDGGAVKKVERDSDGYIQVVCGAPNVHSGMLAAWLPPGSIVPATFAKDPFTLAAREIRGKVSQGMLASPKELDISDSHEGILEIDEEVKVGDDFAATFDLQDEVIIDIENKMFTHRPDLFGVMGVARELAGINQKAFKSPAWYKPLPPFPIIESRELPLAVVNELPQLVPRFTAITLKDVTVAPSPLWLQLRLSVLGIRPINNIVDLTNYYMLLTGQPLHAYDYDKLKEKSNGEATIVIRNPKPSEKITLLNGKTVSPGPEAIMIATDKTLIGVGGIMGGQETEVDSSTTNIAIECATFDMYSVRRTGMSLGIFTDALTRFNKGQSPLQNLAVLSRITADIIKLSGGKVSSHVIDLNHVSESANERGSLYPPVKLSVSFINERLGLDLKAEDIVKLLKNVEFKVAAKADELSVEPPFWRTDIELREDVVEEVGRLTGYDKMPLLLPKREISPAVKDELLNLKSQIRHKLRGMGANEILTYSFIPGALMDKVAQDKKIAFKVSNALRPELQFYRLSLMPSLLEKVNPNIRAGFEEFALFELGKTHSTDQMDEDNLPKEFEFTAFVIAKDNKLKPAGHAYYQAKNYLEELAGTELTYQAVSEETTKYMVTRPYDRARSALVSVKSTGEFLGIIGEFANQVQTKLKLPAYCAGFEVDTSVIGKLSADSSSYLPLSRFPKLTQDISLKLADGVAYGEVHASLYEAIAGQLPDSAQLKLEALDIYQAEGSTDKNMTFRCIISGTGRTMTDPEVNSMLDQAAAHLGQTFGAVRL